MFTEILNRIVDQCPGALGALIMGFDGIGIDEVSREDSGLDLTLIGIEYSNIVKEVRNAGEILQAGAIEEVSIKSGQYYVVLRLLTDDYFIALVIDGSGNFGKGRYLLLRESFSLKSALE